MTESLLTSAQFLVFAALAVGAIVWIVASSIFGGDHGVDHDVDHDVEHDGADHDAGGGEPAVSFFSPKVICCFVLGFGAAGAITSGYGRSVTASVLWGLGCGFTLAILMLAFLRALYNQQANSMVPVGDAIGKTGMVTSNIARSGVGEVTITVGGSSRTELAMSSDGKAIPQGMRVKVLSVSAGQLVVEPTA